MVEREIKVLVSLIETSDANPGWDASPPSFRVGGDVNVFVPPKFDTIRVSELYKSVLIFLSLFDVIQNSGNYSNVFGAFIVGGEYVTYTAFHIRRIAE